MKFWKMHGLGNDFAVFDARGVPLVATPDWSRRIADRRTGIGCDQIILIQPPRSPAAHAYLSFLNGDGSEAGACGNGTRCAAALLLREAPGSRFLLETMAGLLEVDAGNPQRIVVDMGSPGLGWRDVPLSQEFDTLSVPLEVTKSGFSAVATCCSMGNPHVTIFLDHLSRQEVVRVGPHIETHALFPARVNVGFAQVTGPDRLRLEMWERGTGLTLSCGSGACAAGIAAMRRGLTGKRVTVGMERGALDVEWRADGHVLLGGPTALVFTGEASPVLLRG